MSQVESVEDKDLLINGCAPINAGLLREPNSKGNKGQIKPGQVLNPKGRPKGSLNKIQSLFYDDLYHDWESHGNQAIVDLRESSPVKYCQLVASIMPKTVELDDDGTVRWVVASSPVAGELEWKDRHGIRDDSLVIEQDKQED